MKKVCTLVIVCFLMVIFPTLSIAQVDYPTNTIQMVMGYSAGGSGDIVTRALTQEAKKHLGQEIVSTYRAGSSGTLALAFVAAAKPDGYTLGALPSSSITNAPLILDLEFDPFEETIPIIAYSSLRNVVAVKADSPFKTLKEFLEYAKQNPGKATYGHPGIGTGNHLVMAAIAAEEGIKMQFVPLRGDVPVINALLGGHIMVSAGTIGSYIPHIQAGSLRPLATYEAERLEQYPETPSISELGYPYTPRFWMYVYGPKGLPEAILKKLDDAFAKAALSPAYREIVTKATQYPKKVIFRQDLKKELLIEKAKVNELFQKARIE